MDGSIYIFNIGINSTLLIYNSDYDCYILPSFVSLTKRYVPIFKVLIINKLIKSEISSMLNKSSDLIKIKAPTIKKNY